MEAHVKAECNDLVEKLEETKGGAVAIQDYLLPSTSNNIAALVYGSRFPFDHPRRRYLDELLRVLLKAVRAGALAECLPPIVLKILSKLPSMRRTVIISKLKEFIEYTKEQVEQHKSTINEHFNRDFIDGYLKKIKEHETDPASNFLPGFLVGNVLSFFIAGSNTVAVTIHWHMLNFANNADTLQARVQQEIDEVVGRERQPTWEDRHKMPFTVACIWEMYRWNTPSPLGVPRGAGEDTVFDDYYIPKGTTVIPNVWAVHNDPALWKDPSKFAPSRFLNEDGTLIQHKPEYLIPFSIGKRMCPGETLASVEVFLYITCLLQKYRILPADGKSHDINAIDIPWVDLENHKLTFTPR
ncbi:hypothetical protein HPB48_011396 [Haemaphysalis longicornis]|uniref:Cytochrome P450 n=1 Tax=Haemaphysalis longicornis TaxID=44386 RepID=A0A9J6GGJ7_HAELO|nr:hypothetical protein HPB48_011396 [Haemaphysalis longicornis]